MNILKNCFKEKNTVINEWIEVDSNSHAKKINEGKLKRQKSLMAAYIAGQKYIKTILV